MSEPKREWKPKNVGRSATIREKPLPEREQDRGFSNEEWPEPLALPEGLSLVDALDTTLLPAKIAPWVASRFVRMRFASMVSPSATSAIDAIAKPLA